MSQNEHLDHLRHSCAHLLAAAVMELWPNAKRTIGPPIEDGFYYDFDFGPSTGSGQAIKISEEDLPRIEEKMREILPTWKGFERREVTADEAREVFKDNPYKLELIDEFAGGGQSLTLYQSGNYVDLCRGGHTELPAEELKHFKLLSVAGAYWRGSEKNAMLTRIYGTCFPTAKELEDHLAMLEEAKKRDHRKIGRELDLFMFSDLVGPGLPLWTPKGTIIADELERLARETEARGGYLRVRTPHLAKGDLYEKTGHLAHYRETMFPPMVLKDEGTYYVKPMNCPHHHQLFANRPRSYRDLPMRLAEYGMVYRYEDSGALFGLMRVRSLSMNDAHIYVTEEQFEEEFNAVIAMYMEYFKIFGIEKYAMRLSLHDPAELGKKYVNQPELWLKTEEMVRRAMNDGGCTFTEVPNEAAFYGPKVDVEVWSAIGREFTLATNQVDFDVPGKLGLTYTDTDGKEKTPLCIHRAPLGTHERFIGFLIEHFAGAFPVWLSPVQVVLAPVSDQYIPFAEEQAQALRDAGIRVEVDASDETVGKKVRNAELQKVPYTVVLGEKEKSGEDWQIRVRGEKEQPRMPEGKFVELAQQKARERALLTAL